MKYDLGFLGAGNMAEAIARAAIDKGVLPPQAMIAADPALARRDVFQAMGVAAAETNAEVIRQSRQVMIAVKPQVMAAAARDLMKGYRDEQVIISIMAGIRCAKLGEAIGRPARIVRVMPNTSLMVGEGMAGIALGEHARPGDDDFAMALFSAGGKAIRVQEALLDAITAVSGSGPAYVFYLAEAMEQAAAALGLKEHASLLVRQTILGAAQLLAQSPDTPAELRRKVTSPGGTTEAAIRHMDDNRVRDVIVAALAAAERRSRELGA